MRFISHDVYSERSYALRALQISQNADIVEARILVRERREAQRPPGRETDGSSSPSSSSLLLLLHPLIFLTLLFALAARNNSIDQYVFPSGATRGNNAILGTVLLI